PAGACAAVAEVQRHRVRRRAWREPDRDAERASALLQLDDVAADQAEAIRGAWRNQRRVVPRQLRQRFRDLLQPGVVGEAAVVNGGIRTEDGLESLHGGSR